MPSTVAEDLYQGMDAIVQLSGPSGPITVGGFQTVRFSLSHAPVMYPELNEQWDLPLPGKLSASGTASRGWRDAGTIERLLGAAAVGRGIRTRVVPFTMTMTLDCPGKADHGRRVQLTGCIFTQMTWDARSAEGAVDNPIDFSAQGFQYL
jgi:hypothetical protein